MRFGAVHWIMALCAGYPGAAYADVLEIGAQGPVWIAGAPASEHRAIGQSAIPSPDVSTDAIPASVPAAWRERVAVLAAKYDLSPHLIEALVWQESRWHSGAVSPAGAVGLAQLMPGTARQLGLDPLDPSSNIEGGARYLRMQLDAFGGDVERALAAYNAGPGRVLKAGGVPRIRETQNYVTSIMDRLSTSARR